MSDHSPSAGFDAGGDPLANLRDALDKVAAASRVIIVHPDHEDAVNEAVAASPFPGLLKVTVSPECPRDRLFLIPTPLVKPFTTHDTSPEAPTS